MRYSYEKAVDITTDLSSGDVGIPEQLKIATTSKYNLIPTGIMVCSATNQVVDVVCKLRGGDDSITFNLQTNVIYELAVEKVYNSGTTTEKIILLGAIN
jgi:hypothetical protein